MIVGLEAFCTFSESNQKCQGGWKVVIEMYTDVTVWSLFLCSALTVTFLQRCADSDSGGNGRWEEFK